MTAALPIRVKVCGLTRAADARHALAAGADALGFVFHPGSPRGIDGEAWRALRPALPAWAYAVAVFTTGDLDLLEEVVVGGGFPEYQVHGAWDSDLAPLPGRILRRAADPARDCLDAAAAFLDAGPDRALLLDPRRGDRAGGTGEVHDPAVLAPWLERLPRERVALAGGLDPGNVGDVVARFEPAAVDASSGLEASPGVKDPEKVTRFVAAARRARGEPAR